MTPKLMVKLAEFPSRSTRKVREILPTAVSQGSATNDRVEVSAPAVPENVTSTVTSQLVCFPGAVTPSEIFPSTIAILSIQPQERIGATLDPFHTLPIELPGGSAQNVFHYCGLPSCVL